MRTPWKLQQIEPDVWAIVDADGEVIVTPDDGAEIDYAQDMCEVANGMYAALEDALAALESVSGMEDHPATRSVRDALARVRGKERTMGREVRMPGTVRVKIAVVVDEQGDWYCAGWGGLAGETKKSLRQMQVIASDTLEPRGAEVYHWVEADVPTPIEQTVEGDVLPSDQPTEDPTP